MWVSACCSLAYAVSTHTQDRLIVIDSSARLPVGTSIRALFAASQAASHSALVGTWLNYNNKNNLKCVPVCFKLIQYVNIADEKLIIGSWLFELFQIMVFICMEPNKVTIHQVIFFFDYIKLQGQGGYCLYCFLKVQPKIFIRLIEREFKNMYLGQHICRHPKR